MEWEVYGRGRSHITVFNGRQLRVDLPDQINGEDADVRFDGDDAIISYGPKEMRFSLQGSMPFETDRNF